MLMLSGLVEGWWSVGSNMKTELGGGSIYTHYVPRSQALLAGLACQRGDVDAAHPELSI